MKLYIVCLIETDEETYNPIIHPEYQGVYLCMLDAKQAQYDFWKRYCTESESQYLLSRDVSKAEMDAQIEYFNDTSDACLGIWILDLGEDTQWQ